MPLQQFPAICLACTLLITTAGAAGAAESAVGDKGAPPNIVLIYVDDMGWGDTKCFNPDSKIETPHLDELARGGMRLTDAHAAGALCHPSRYGLLTGRYPFRTELAWQKKPCINEGRLTLASLLKKSGYATAMVGKWHLGYFDDGYDKPIRGGPFDRGFDYFFGIRASTDIPPYFYIENNRVVAAPTDKVPARSTPGWSPIQGEFWRTGGIAPGLKLVDVLPKFTEKSVEVLRNHREKSPDKPLFLYVALPAPHTPWLPTRKFKDKSKVGLYGDFVNMVDASVGRILETLDELKMTDDTMVIFTSDNGPVWYPRDVEKYSHSSTGPFRGMKADAWEGGHRMPLVVRWPGKVAPGSTSKQVVSQADMLATFAAITGQTLPDDAGEDSCNILPVLLGTQPEQRPIRKALVTSHGRNRMTIRSGDWKLIPFRGSGGFSRSVSKKPSADSPPGQLYNMKTDPGETKNVYREHPEIVASLTRLLDKYIKEGRSVPVRTTTGKHFDKVSIPAIDLDAEKDRQVVVDREKGQYLGHPTTCLLEDGKTVLCVYPKGHGRGAIVYKRSTDGGRTWSERLPTPANWATSKEVPTLHRVVDANGKKRIIMWSGLYPARLAVSEDDGKTWSELKPVGDWGGIVVMGFVEPLKTGKGHYMAMFHDDGRFIKKDGKRTGLFTLYKTLSTDGGLTWSRPEALWQGTDIHLCEPGCIRSPDGRTLAVLLRENARRKNSHVIFSTDEGKTWTTPREVPLALTGDRHTGRYTPDGRLLISFRCRSPKEKSAARPFEGDWVGWVGTWDDIVQGREGQYSVRLKDNTHGYDTSYPGVERLPDGTILATTYGHWDKGEKPYILSIRLRLDELDRKNK